MKTSRARDEYTNFTSALRKVLRVSHGEMKAKLDAEKRERKQHPKRASARASDEKQI